MDVFPLTGRLPGNFGAVKEFLTQSAEIMRSWKMMEQVENSMAAGWRWTPESPEISQKLNGAGWKEMGTGIFVPDEDAYDYALERISLDEDLKKEFVEWFYSGNWVKEE